MAEAIILPDALETYTMKGDLQKYLEICEEYSEIGYIDVLYDNGIIFVNMAPPSRRHNRISTKTIITLSGAIREKSTCEVLTSDEAYKLVDSSQAKPDVSVVCKNHKDALIPVLAVEVLSPSNGMNAPEPYEHYFGRKINKLLASGCKAVLCVRQDIKEVYLHTQSFDEYDTYRQEDVFTVPGLDIDLCVSDLYPENLDLF